MGRDKASLPLDGAGLAARTAGLLAAVCGSVKLVGRHAHAGFPVVDDATPGSGPLGAVIAALAQTTARWNLIVACDMPRLTRAFLEELKARAEAASAISVVPRGPSGRLDPLCAAYRKDSEALLRTVFDSGVRSMQAALGALTCDIWDLPDAAPLCNINTPEDWEEFLRDLPAP
jgi:molybdopterin-guanine dinucleotide biosynthesis protein A